MREPPKKVRSPVGMAVMTGIVVLVVLYYLWQLVEKYRAGGSDAPNLATVLLTGVVLIGGCGYILYLAVRIYRQSRRQQDPPEDTAE